MTRSRSVAIALCTMIGGLPAAAAAGRHHHGAAMPASASAPAPIPTDTIVAVVNGDAITEQDVENREKLFALTTGMHIDPAVLARLRPQITNQLIDEKLRLQEMQRRKIVIPPEQIAKAIAGIESRNGMAPHALEEHLQAAGVSETTLIDQIRAQIGWEYILRGDLGSRGRVTPAEIAAREKLLKAEAGEPEFNISEIFIPVEDPTHAADAERFASTVISQLRAGAAFGVVAAQFGTGESALQGGLLGWVQASRLDPQVVSVLERMPIGAVSDPIRVAGGYDIVTLHARRALGNQMETVLGVREVFFPFTQHLDPSQPTAQQKTQLAKAQASVGAPCEALDATAKAENQQRPADPGPLILADLNPTMQKVLSSVATGATTKPLVSLDGIAVIGVCSRDEKNVALESEQQVANNILDERVDLAARQQMNDLRRQAVIDNHAG